MSLFSRIVIVGVGMMGGSIGLAAKKRGLTDYVIGVDPNPDHLNVALRRGAIDRAAGNLDEGIRGLGLPSPELSALNPSGNDLFRPLPELVVVAAPVGAIAGIVGQIAATIETAGTRRNVLITDVGSTKEAICFPLAGPEKPLPGGCRFIGSHPIAGTELRGPENAIEHLFEKRLAIVTPYETHREIDLGFLIRFWRKLGSNVICLTPSEHDRILARTSHLPHLLSALLAERLSPEDVPYTGTGFHSTSRLASGGPSLWRDIVSTNPEAILDALRDYEDGLRKLRETIERKDWDAVTGVLETAKRKRDFIEEQLSESRP